MITMKRIILEYDEQTSNLNVRAEGFTEAEVIAVMDEARENVRRVVVENLKKKKIALAGPFSAIQMPKA